MGLLNKMDFNNDPSLNVIVKKENKNDIAIIGISLKAPNAENINEFWNMLADNCDCINTVPEGRLSDMDEYGSYVLDNKDINAKKPEGGYLEDVDKFDCNFFNISPNEAKLMDPNQRLLLQIIWNAFVDAGYRKKELKGKKIGVYIGYRGDNPFDYKRLISEIGPEDTSLALAGNINSVISSRISYLLDLKGPAMIIDTACSSSLTALHIACNSIINGECEGAVVGSSALRLLTYTEKGHVGIESSCERVRSFDKYADGTVFGEGVAAVVLKPLDDAVRDKDNIYAVIKGSAINQDGNSVGLTAPNAAAQEKVLMSAWKNANIDPKNISYIETHGTGTNLGDPIEIEGITRAFSHYTDAKQFCAIGALKSNIGHLDCASGLFGLIKAVLSLKKQRLLPINHFRLPNDNIVFLDSPVYINNVYQKWKGSYPRICGVSSFGLSGTNSHVVLQEYQQPECDEKSRNYFLLSGRSMDDLRKYATEYIDFLKNDQNINKTALEYSLLSRAEYYDYRIGVIYDSLSELKEKLRRFANGEQIKDDELFYLKTPEDTDIPGTSAILAVNDRLFVEKFYSDIESIGGICTGDKLRKITTLGYPFRKTRCWIEKANKSERKIVVSDKTCDGRIFSDTEKAVATVYSDILGISEFDIHDNFYNLGGDSIIALRVANKLGDILSVKLKVADILEHDNVADLALYIDKLNVVADAEAFENDESLHKKNEIPLSEAQLVIYRSCLDGNLTYNIPQLYEVEGKLEKDRLNRSINRIVEQQDLLRATIHFSENEIVYRIKSEFEYILEEIELDTDIDGIYRKLVTKFDFSEGPLFRVTFVHCQGKNYVFFDIHHIIADGTSLGIFSRDIMTVYHHGELDDLKWQYVDYIEYRNNLRKNASYKKQLEFWENEYAFYRENYDTVNETKRINTYNSRKIEIDCTKELTEELIASAARNKCSLFVMILAAFRIFIHNYTEKRTLVVGLPFSGRTNPCTENLIGMFVNVLRYTSVIDPEQSIEELILETNEKVIRMIDNQEIFVDELKEFDFNYDVLLVHQNYYNPELKFDNIKIIQRNGNEGYSGTGAVIQTLIRNGILRCELEYNTGLFDEEDALGFLNEFMTVLNEINCDKLSVGEIYSNSQEIVQEIALPDFSFE